MCPAGRWPCPTPAKGRVFIALLQIDLLVDGDGVGVIAERIAVKRQGDTVGVLYDRIAVPVKRHHAHAEDHFLIAIYVFLGKRV